jgi:hypothetical protein
MSSMILGKGSLGSLDDWQRILACVGQASGTVGGMFSRGWEGNTSQASRHLPKCSEMYVAAHARYSPLTSFREASKDPNCF